jgi:endonuclease/exonuclease/phosphatase family metal-dependent hydrolase
MWRVAPVNRAAQVSAMHRLKLLLATLALAVAVQARPFTVVAYNVENLFDLDGVSAYDEYQLANYTPAHALTKLQNIAKVVARFGEGRGPDVLLLTELEVDATPGATPADYDAILKRYAGTTLAAMLSAKPTADVADLPSEALLLKALADAGMTGYRVVIGANVTAAGSERAQQAITCAVFTRFPVRAVRSHATLDARAILEVQVDVDGAPLYVFANHWKSGASDPATEPTRVANAKTLRARLDEILRADPNADIILGGDFNSQYNQKQRYPAMKATGINDVLGSQGNELAVRQAARPLYNLWFELPAAQRGSDTFRGEWGTLMHLIISRGLYDYRGVQYVDNSFAVAKFSNLNADAMGLPVRWSAAGPAGSGFSDHFPVYAKFTTVPEGKADKWLNLRASSSDENGPAEPVKIAFDQLNLAAVALDPAKLPAGTALRAPANIGKIVRVDGVVRPGTRLAVEFLGESYDIYSPDPALRTRLREQFKAGERVRFHGELGQYRGRWQFVVQDAARVK